MKPENKFRSRPRCFLVLSFLLLLALFSWKMGQGAEIPTIEELTGGKLKVGDLVTKENVDLVKGFLPLGSYEAVKRGMVLIIAPTTPFELTRPKYFIDLTEKNKGLAVIGKNNVVYTKDGKKWPGGIPFLDPKTGIEAMANFRFSGSWGCDDYNQLTRMDYVDKKGVAYKYNYSWYSRAFVNPRMYLPPKPAFPGHEEEFHRSMIVFFEPYDVKGVSLFYIRYYDETEKPDEGFLYLPALKRTRRISATNWIDNVAGTDLLWGDCGGFFEPYSLWDFKLLEKRVMLIPGYSMPYPEKRPDGSYDFGIKYDVGRKFPRFQWEVRPTVVVEAIPKYKHAYGKRIFYLDGMTFKDAVFDSYDRQMGLWKTWVAPHGCFKGKDGLNYSNTHILFQYDLQVDHNTILSNGYIEFNKGVPIEDYTLKKMLEMGR